MIKEKDQILEMIKALPEESTVDDILEELYFRLQIDRGLKELEEGKGIPHEQVRSRILGCLKK